MPKGLVGRGEAPQAAQREVREEAGVETKLVASIDTIQYWYVGSARGGQRVRFHKQAHFFLFRYVRGDVADHDSEVNAARWVVIEAAGEMLAFANEQQIIARAKVMLLAAGE